MLPRALGSGAPRMNKARLLLMLLLAVGAATMFLSYGRATPPVPTPPPEARTEAGALDYSYLLDVAGWYEITPNESAVASPFALRLETRQLPARIGGWSGSTYEMNPAINEWFENPDVALSQIYRDDRDHQVWFSMFGSRGRKSYFLFEHTPITSYPAAGWTLVQSGVTTVPVGSSGIRVQRALLSLGSERRWVYYWYLWSDFDRDPEQGVIAARLHVPVTTTDADAEAAAADFIRALFPQVIPWHRF